MPICPHRTVAALLSLSLTASALAENAPPSDLTLDAAQRIIALAASDKSVDGRTVRVALKALRDPALLPLFEALQKSDDPGTRLDAALAIVVATKDPKRLDLKALLELKDDARIGSALAQLIDNEVITVEQLRAILEAKDIDTAHKVMAASELSRRKALPDRSFLVKTLQNADPGRYDIVRHYAAITLLENKDDAENAAALKTLAELAAKHNPRLEGVQELMLLRVFKDKILLATPWVESVARDELVKPRLRQTAIATLLALKVPTGKELLQSLVETRKETGDQIVLGLTAIEFADQLKPENVAGLGISKSGNALTSPLVVKISDIARKAVGGADVSPALTDLVKEGQPIVLNWALGYSASAEPARRLALRAAVISQASIVDDVRGPDYERAAVAANKIIEDASQPGDAGRKEIARILKSDNRPAIEATLLGLLRSSSTDLAPLVMPIWSELQVSAPNENAANYAALLLAREGHKEPLNWLAGMIQGGTVQNIGFRALAAWHYAKLKNQTGPMLQRIVAGTAKKNVD